MAAKTKDMRGVEDSVKAIALHVKSEIERIDVELNGLENKIAQFSAPAKYGKKIEILEDELESLRKSVQQESAAGEKKIHELGIKIGEQIQSDIGDISKKMAAHGRAPAAKEIDSFARKIDRLEAMLESLNKKLGRLDDYIAKELSEIDNRMSKVEDFCEEERKAGQKIGIYEDVQKILSSK